MVEYDPATNCLESIHRAAFDEEAFNKVRKKALAAKAKLPKFKWDPAPTDDGILKTFSPKSIDEESWTYYEGERNKAGQKHGKGTEIRANGNLYEGYFRSDERHGRGRLIQANGTVYEGEFKNGLQHGRGIEKSEDGRVW